MSDLRTVLQVVDWRRRVFALYAEVRGLAGRGSAAEAHEHWCRARDHLFADHPASPLLDRTGFTGLPTAAYDPSWRFEVEIEPGEEQRIVVGTGTDGDVGFSRVGLVRVPDVGTLDVWCHDGYGGGLFVPVRDTTAGRTTYGGGRYLIDTAKGADLGSGATGGLVLDFNFAYHPSCAYDPAWACPLPRPGNTVDVGIGVGERLGEVAGIANPTVGSLW